MSCTRHRHVENQAPIVICGGCEVLVYPLTLSSGPLTHGLSMRMGQWKWELPFWCRSSQIRPADPQSSSILDLQVFSCSWHHRHRHHHSHLKLKDHLHLKQGQLQMQWRSFVFSTCLSGRRSGGTWGASAVRSIFICHSNASAMAPTTLRPITFKKGVPTFHQVWCAWRSFSPKKCHANALENEVYCLLHCPVSSKCCSCHTFPQKCDVNVLEYEVYCLLRSHCFFKYCACHISFPKCAVNALDFEGDCFLRSHGFFSKYCSCHNAIGAEFLVAYLLLRRRRQKNFTAETHPPKYCSWLRIQHPYSKCRLSQDAQFAHHLPVLNMSHSDKPPILMKGFLQALCWQAVMDRICGNMASKMLCYAF